MSSTIISSNSENTMTSREIAVLTKKEHKNVRRDIESMFLDLNVDALKFEHIYIDSMKRVQKEYRLPYDETVCLLTGYDAAARMAVIKRWKELESREVAQVVAFNIPTSLSGALRLAAEQAETIEVQAKQLEEAKPSIEFVEKYADSTGSKGFRQVCKLLHANENVFREFLQTRNIMYRLNGEWTAYREHIAAGRFDVKVGTSETTSHAFNQCRFTPKGILWVTGEWAKFNLDLGDAA